jgi:hypothetical protein
MKARHAAATQTSFPPQDRGPDQTRPAHGDEATERNNASSGLPK